MSSRKSLQPIGRLFERRFRGEANRAPKVNRPNRRGRAKPNYFRVRQPPKKEELPKVPKLPPPQPMPKPLTPPPAPIRSSLQSAVVGTSENSDYLKRLSIWFQENWPVLVLNFGSLCTLTGFTRSDILELRTLSMTGSLSFVLYSLQQSKILWPSVAWSSIFAAVNGFKISRILSDRISNVNMTEEQENVFVQYFMPHGITPKQFERVERNAEKIILKKGSLLLRKGDELDSVYLVIKGTTKAHILGRHLTAISLDKKKSKNGEPQPSQSGAWLGEMGFLDYYWENQQGKVHSSEMKKALYTIIASEDCEVLRWSHEDMEKLMDSSNDLRNALTRAMTSALVNKVVSMTISKTKQLPTWSEWLSDWGHNSITVKALAELPESKEIVIPPAIANDDDDQLALLAGEGR